MLFLFFICFLLFLSSVVFFFLLSTKNHFDFSVIYRTKWAKLYSSFVRFLSLSHSFRFSKMFGLRSARGVHSNHNTSNISYRLKMNVVETRELELPYCFITSIQWNLLNDVVNRFPIQYAYTLRIRLTVCWTELSRTNHYYQLRIGNCDDFTEFQMATFSFISRISYWFHFGNFFHFIWFNLWAKI